MISEPSPGSVGPSAIKFLIGIDIHHLSPFIYPHPKPNSAGARQCVKKSHIELGSIKVLNKGPLPRKRPRQK
ncbi:hypothetical protein A2U01_0070937, partial [Trifolium medium]|nr:hypothetical protein [Trifolium medium]